MIDEEARWGDRHWGVGWAEQGDSEAWPARCSGHFWATTGACSRSAGQLRGPGRWAASSTHRLLQDKWGLDRWTQTPQLSANGKRPPNFLLI